MGHDLRIDVEALVSDAQARCELNASIWVAAAANTRAIIDNSAAARNQPASEMIQRKCAPLLEHIE